MFPTPFAPANGTTDPPHASLRTYRKTFNIGSEDTRLLKQINVKHACFAMSRLLRQLTAPPLHHAVRYIHISYVLACHARTPQRQA